MSQKQKYYLPFYDGTDGLSYIEVRIPSPEVPYKISLKRRIKYRVWWLVDTVLDKLGLMRKHDCTCC